MEEDQIHWQDSIEEYNDPLEFGPEIPSSIAGAAKVFWEKSLKSGIIDQKMANAKIPSNCHFLVPKRTNKEIFVTLSSFHWTVDNQVQELQKIQAASVSLLLKASSQLSNMMKLVKQKGINLDLKTPMNSLKDSLSLAGKTSQSLNRLRRQLIKPSLPSKFAKLADNDDDSAKFLFGDNISESLESLSKEHKIKCFLKDKPKGHYEATSNKRKYAESSNWNSSSKLPKRTEGNSGQRFKNSHTPKRPSQNKSQQHSQQQRNRQHYYQ